MIERFFEVTVLIAFAILLPFAYAEYGESCMKNQDCKTGKFYNEKCSSGKCRCKLNYYPIHSQKAELRCKSSRLMDFCSKYTSALDCPKDQICINRTCTCNEGFVNIGQDCYPKTYAGPLETCEVESSPRIAKICDIHNSTYCESGMCLCFKEYFFNSSSSKCEPKTDFIKLHNISEYKALPTQYCRVTSDCVDGLDCNPKHKCGCPSECTYKEKKLVCDCGLVELEVPIVVIIVGTILGLVFCLCWCCLINSAVRTKDDKYAPHEMVLKELDLNDKDNYHIGVSPTYPIEEESPKQVPPPYPSVPVGFGSAPPQPNIISDHTHHAVNYAANYAALPPRSTVV